eukprot:TRINITY_DN2608_c0_g1_i3.p1 TRINITY_DN2608_c0_g1~~TRINITY_DN2608_c0_g1_i3.p1  ORF type:complete len:188 (-),score=64.85 TRINITY_DN2608_c0_g1_i3:103-666(-)
MLPPSVNPLCEQLLATSKILAQMSPKGPDSDAKQEKNSSSGDTDLSIPPPGLTKQKEATESNVVKEKEDANNEDASSKEEDPQPKSGEEVTDSALDVVKGDAATIKLAIKTTPIPPPKIKSKADNEPTIEKAVDEPKSNKSKVNAGPPNSKAKADIEPSTEKAVDEPKPNKSKVNAEPPNSKAKSRY